jgi:hypothetical protein
LHTTCPDLLDDGPHIGSERVRRRHARGIGLVAGLGQPGIAERHAARLRNLWRTPSALRDHFPFVLRHGRKNVHSQLVGVRVIGRAA